METMWVRCGNTTLHSSIALQDENSMRKAMEFNFPNVQYILDTPRGQSGDFSRRGKPFAPSSKFQATPEKGMWKIVSPTDSILSNMHQARVHVFSDSVLCLRTHAMCEATTHISTRWAKSRQHGGTTTSKGLNSKFFDCELQLLAAKKQHVSSTDDERCTSTASSSWV